jgi:chemotaxis protein MotB
MTEAARFRWGPLAVALVGLAASLTPIAPPGMAQAGGQPADASSALVAEPGVSASELQAAIDAIKRRVAAQQEGRAASGTSELAAELSSARDAIAELTRNLSRLRAERDELQAALEALRQSEAALKAEITEWRERGTALQSALSAAERATDEAQAELARATEGAAAERAAQASALADSRRQTEAVRARLAELETALAAAEQAAVEQATALEAAAGERAALDAELAAGREQAKADAARLAALEADLAESRAAADGLDEELAALREAARRGEADLAAAAEARAAIEQRLAQSETAAAAAAAAAAASLAEREQEMAGLREVASRSVAEVQELGETLLATLDENETLVDALAEARQSRSLIEEELTAMRREIESLAAAGAMAGSEDGADGVPIALVASDAAIEAIDAELADARQQIATLTEELIARDQQLATASANGDADALSQQVGLLERRVAALTAENAALAERLAAQATPGLVTASLAPEEAIDHYLGQLNAVDTGDGWWMTVPEGLVFAPGSDQLAEGTEPVVAQLAALLGYFGDARVRIVGHTDSFGDAAANRELSLQRAETVGRALVEGFGVAAGRITTEGFGEDQPIASNETIEGRRANRRVEVYVER